MNDEELTEVTGQIIGKVLSKSLVVPAVYHLFEVRETIISLEWTRNRIH